MAKLFSNKVFQDPDAARVWLETMLWPNGPICGHCGVVGEAKALSSRPGTYQCNACRKQFTVTVGTVFERSHIPLNKWLLATFLFCASKKGVSAHQIHRMLDITYKSAWFMMHRIREAVAPGSASGPMGGLGKIVEADETFIGGKEKNKHVGKRDPKKIGGKGKMVAFALVERGGKMRSFHVPRVNAKTLRPILTGQLARETALMTDDAGQYRHMGLDFNRHETVNHGEDEYVRGDAHTNTVEGFFSILKRGINGTYHHVSEAHLKRYLAEFDFRYNERSALGVNDEMRAAKALQGIVGKRLTYRRTSQRQATA
jgi:transposase-like protein